MIALRTMRIKIDEGPVRFATMYSLTFVRPIDEIHFAVSNADIQENGGDGYGPRKC